MSQANTVNSGPDTPESGSWAEKKLKIQGMTCAGCELTIENALTGLTGITNVKASYAGSFVSFIYNPDKLSLQKIIKKIESHNYTVVDGKETEKQGNGKMPITHLIGIGVILLSLYLIINNTIGFNFIPNITQNMGYGILFVVGLLTSVHCVAMCGGINMSQCMGVENEPAGGGKLSKIRPSLLYNAGRVLSYTLIGGIVGAFGSVVSFSGTMKGFIAILSGVFMLIMGFNMLGLFPKLRKFVPRMPKVFGKKLQGGKRRSPFVVGLLNGLMPCGPLQSMQLYALGTGSFFAGALSMLVFSLGTVPLMFLLGAASSFLSGRFTKKMMKAGAVLVMVLGVVMLNRGFALSGVNLLPSLQVQAAAANTAQLQNGVQIVTTTLQSGSYEPITVQKGIPVKWTIKAGQGSLNGCNRTMVIPKYNITQTLKEGDNVIQFTPDETGNIPYSCWMGMIRSNISVVDDLTNPVVSGGSQQAGSAAGKAGGVTGGCCGNVPSQFANGKIPTDTVGVSTISGSQQEVTVTVNDQGFTPAVLVVQKNIPLVIKFDTQGPNACIYSVVFPAYNGQLDLSTQKQTPVITPASDFTFQCSMGMINGYVKVVDDIKNFDMQAVKNEVSQAKPAGNTGGGCCG